VEYNETADQDADVQLAENLRLMVTEGGAGNFVVAAIGARYVQFRAACGDTQVHWEAVSDNFLSDEMTLAAWEIERLREWSFTEDEEWNFWRLYDAPDEASLLNLARYSLQLLAPATDLTGQTDVEIRLVLE